MNDFQKKQIKRAKQEMNWLLLTPYEKDFIDHCNRNQDWPLTKNENTVLNQIAGKLR